MKEKSLIDEFVDTFNELKELGCADSYLLYEADECDCELCIRRYPVGGASSLLGTKNEKVI